MNDARLKKGIKRSLILFGIGIFVVLCLALYDAFYIALVGQPYIFLYLYFAYN